MTGQPTASAGSEAVQETLPQLNIGEPPATPQPQAEKTEPQKALDGQPETEKQAQEDVKDPDEPKRNRVPASVRIAQLNGKFRTEKARADYLQGELDRLTQRQQPPKAIEDMSFDEREEFRLRRALDSRDAERTQAELQRSEEEAHNARRDMFLERMESAKDRIPADTLDKFSKMAVTPVMANLIMGAEQTPELVHYLTTNPQAAQSLADLTDPKRLSRMTPTQAAEAAAEAAFEMARITAGLKPAQPKKVSTAPAPSTTLNGGTTPPAKSLEEEDDMSAYAARRKASWAKGER